MKPASSFLIFLLMGAFSLSSAQVTRVISRVNVPTALESRPLPISVDLTRNTGIDRVICAYRSFGESEYREQEMLLAGRVATLTLPVETVTPPYIEYYVKVELEDGTTETFPLQSPELNPEKIVVKQLNPKDLEIRMLSPEQGETVALEEFVMAVSLFYASDAVDRKATRLYLDGVDVSRDAILSEDVILYSPRNFPRPLALGAHFIRVELHDTTGKPYHSTERSFNLSTASAIAEQKARLQLGINGQLEYRNENIGATDTSITYLRGGLRSSGSYGFLNFGAMMHLDNQDKPHRQPQNRYLFSLETSFLRLQYGDAYPKFPSLIVSGKRIRGLTANLALGFFNVDISYGETKRIIEGEVLRDTAFARADTSAVEARPKTTRFKTFRGDSVIYSIFSPGTHKQNIIAVRPSFGSGENFQLGFTYMKAKDDVSSIEYGTLPSENLVVGTDLLIAFDDQRVKFETQASFSLENKNVAPGNFTRKDYEGIVGLNDTTLTPEQREKKKKEADDLERTGKLAEKFITVNANLFPGVEGLGSDPTPAISMEGALTLNYFNNYILATFFRRGAGYKSFGNEFVQTDVQGFSVSDRMRLFTNRLLISLSYEKRSDNTADTKPATTTFSILNSSVSVNPGLGWPTITVGYGFNTRISDLEGTRYDLKISRDTTLTQKKKSADDATTRLFFGASYDFTLGAKHSLSLSVNSSDRKDNTFYKRGQENLAVQTAVTSTFTIPLQTTFGFGINQNQSEYQMFVPSGPNQGQDSTLSTSKFNFTSISVSAQYRMLNDALRLVGSISPTFGDLTRTTIQLGGDYEVFKDHHLELSLGYIQNAGVKDDIISNLMYRFNF